MAKLRFILECRVFYFSRTRKYELENEKVHYLLIERLLENCDDITIHLPKNTTLLTENEFMVKKVNSILVNTSLVPTFGKDALISWLSKDKTSYAILDAGGADDNRDEIDNLTM